MAFLDLFDRSLVTTVVQFATQHRLLFAIYSRAATRKRHDGFYEEEDTTQPYPANS